MSTMVSTTVNSTTRVPTKPRHSSRRREESNNISQIKLNPSIMDVHGMDYRCVVASGPELSSLSADLLLLVLTPEQGRTGCEPIDKVVADALAGGDLELKEGQSLYVHRPAGLKAPRLALAVAGGGSARQVRSALAKLAPLTKGAKVAHVAVAPAAGLTLGPAQVEAIVQAVQEAHYVYRLTKPSAAKPAVLRKVTVASSPTDVATVRQSLRQGEALAAGVALARELGNRPGNHCTPTVLAQEAKLLAREFKAVKVEVLERPTLEKLGMGSFLSVTNGSAQPPKFIVLRYEGGPPGQAAGVVVGTGSTFDQGGMPMNAAGAMDEMKCGMGGAASVLGTFRAVAELAPKVNLIGLIPSCENMPSGTAVKPGDVVTSMSGQTIEILNTDAEGRLI